jgi:hypothetical protein
MGSVNASQIPEEQHMWTDIWNWRKKYYYPEDDDSWWKEFTETGIVIGEKYATKLSHEIIFAIFNDVQSRSKKLEQTEVPEQIL